jgi:hypothetical protein
MRGAWECLIALAVLAIYTGTWFVIGYLLGVQ